MDEQRKNKILIISFAVPYPPDDGGKIYIFGSVGYLRKYFDITLVFYALTETDHQNINLLKEIWPDVTIEIVSYYTPPTIHNQSISHKFWDKYSKLKRKIFSNRHGITSKPEKNFLYDATQSNNFTLIDAKFVNTVDEILKREEFDIVQVEYTPYLSLINLIPKSSLSVFVEIESRNSVFGDYLQLQDGASSYVNYLIQNTKHLEFSYMSKYDLIFALSEEDLKRLSKALPYSKVLLSQYSVLDHHIRPIDEICKFSPDKLVFMGSENHAPNKDALWWFIKSILPKLSGELNMKLFVTGKWSDEFKQEFELTYSVEFTGYIDDLSAILKDSILIVPIRIGGGGVRAKVIQAMAFGIPIVSTSLGCEGIGVINKESVLIANTEADFVKSIIEIAGSKDLALKLIQNAHKLIQQRYTKTVTGAQRMNIYETSLDKKKQNFNIFN